MRFSSIFDVSPTKMHRLQEKINELNRGKNRFYKFFLNLLKID